MDIKKWGTRLVALLLAVVSLVAFGTMKTSAVDKDQIKYTDLFFGYDSYYLGHPWNDWLHLYASENVDLMARVYNEYLDSDQFTLTIIKEQLKAATDLREAALLISTLVGYEDLRYESLLDVANSSFAKKLLDSAVLNVLVSNNKTSSKWGKFMKNIISLNSGVFKDLTAEKITLKEAWSQVGQEFCKSRYFIHLTSEQVAASEEFLNQLAEINDTFKLASRFVDAICAVGTALMMEEIRMELLDTIINNCTQETDLWNGMTRLKTQLRNGWSSYFLGNYLNNAIIGDLVGLGTKLAFDGTPYGIVSAAVKIASFVVFDLILNVPSLDDCLAQQVLYNYTNSLTSALKNKRAVFKNQFTSDDIIEYEDLFTAMMAAVGAGLDATEKLEISSNRHSVENIRIEFKSFNYDSYIDSVKTTISLASPDEVRYRPTDKGWNLPSSTQFLAAADEVEPNSIYTFNGAIQGNVTLTGNDPLLTDCNPLNINGDFTVNGKLMFDKNRIVVEGNTTIGHLYMQNEEDYLLTKGDFAVGNGVTSAGGVVSAGTVEVKGNFRIAKANYAVYNEYGTHKTVLSGESLQTVSFALNFSYYGMNYFSTLELQNDSSSGVVFNTVIKVSTLFNHNQNVFALYNNGSESTFVDYDGDGLKDNVDPYPTLKPGSASDFIISDIAPQIYTGETVTAPFTVTCQNDELVEGKHYEVAYQNNDKPGTATIVITGIDNFDGTIEKTFEIYCDHTPGEWVVVQTATTTEEGQREQYCTICGETVESEVIEKLPPKAVEIAGFDSNQERSVDYKTTITFHSNLDESVEDGEVHWYVNGKDSGTGKDFTVSDATSTYTVQSKVIKDGKVIAESGVETVTVKSSFFQRIIAFIKRIFNRKAFIIDQR